MSGWRILFLNASPLYADGLAAGLREAGHEVHLFDPTSMPRYCHGEAVASMIEAVRPEIAVSMGHAEFFMDAAAVFAEIKRHGIFHVYWATEDRPFHRQISLPCAAYAQAVLTIDSGSLPHYQARGIPAEVLPFACNPAIHHDYPPDPALVHDLVLIAHNTPAGGTYRQKSLINLLLPFLDGGYDLAVWGAAWDQPFVRGLTLPARFYQGVLSYEDAARAVSSAKIVLGPQWDAFSATQVSCRTFEILGSGGFLLTADVPGVRYFFRHGIHLLTTDSPGRTKTLVQQYLADEAGRRGIAAQGRNLVYARHTYLHRARQFEAAMERWRP